MTQGSLRVTHLNHQGLTPPPARVSVELQRVAPDHQRPQPRDLEDTSDEALIQTGDAVRKPEAEMVNMLGRIETDILSDILLTNAAVLIYRERGGHSDTPVVPPFHSMYQGPLYIESLE